MRETQEKTPTTEDPDFAETVELCIANGPPRIRSWSSFIRWLVNLFICVTQTGFCCVYFVFIATNFKQVGQLLLMFLKFFVLFLVYQLQKWFILHPYIDLGIRLWLGIQFLLTCAFNFTTDHTDIIDYEFKIFGAMFNDC